MFICTLFVAGLTKAEYAERRQRLLELFVQSCSSVLGSPSRTKANYLILLNAAELRYSAPDVPYVFRQYSNFLYLSGYQEPSSVLAIYNRSLDSLDHAATLFVAERDAQKELWDGPVSGTVMIAYTGGYAILGVLSDLDTKKIIAHESLKYCLPLLMNRLSVRAESRMEMMFRC